MKETSEQTTSLTINYITMTGMAVLLLIVVALLGIKLHCNKRKQTRDKKELNENRLVDITYNKSTTEFDDYIETLDAETKNTLIFVAGMDSKARKILWETIQHNAAKEGKYFTEADFPQVAASKYGKRELKYDVTQLNQGINCQLERKIQERILEEGPSNTIFCPMGY